MSGCDCPPGVCDACKALVRACVAIQQTTDNDNQETP